MKLIKYVLMFILIFTACKSKKALIESDGSKKISNREVIKNHVANKLNKKTVEAKFKAYFKNEKQDIGFNIQLKIEKDKAIYIKGTKFITVFKAKITPKNVAYYSPYFKNYFEGDFTILRNILGTEINFKQIQNLFLGQTIFDIKSRKQNILFENKTYVLTPKNQNDLFNFICVINAENFKIKRQSISSKQKDKELNISYPSYTIQEGTLFPKNIDIAAKKAGTLTNIALTLRSLSFNNKINFSFKIPSGYKEIKL